MNTYMAFFNHSQIELEAPSQYAAVLRARELLKVRKSQHGLLSVVLINAGGIDVSQSTQFVGE